jgi:flavin reductase (DIM6/NTAB) family NADH-FMN oxidoreductase RutF
MNNSAQPVGGPTSAPGSLVDTVMRVDAADFEDIGLDVFRAIMGSFASGVSVITSLDTTEDIERPCGMTCSAVCSVSADPPLLLSCVRTPSVTLDAIRATGRFVVNFLDTNGRDFSDLFSSRNANKFADVRWHRSDQVGMPLLEPTVAYAECTVHDLMAAGDHMIVLGRVVGGGVFPDRFPLGYWRGNYVGVFRVTRRPERG